ncbi:hypothetical protein NIES2119_27820 [[Phormidium ambiguum] IAM M-71]|uniref:Uncharacterized protein n=1 Tax=[Phormidium ambiguum] IAM M-71 TaxID=454136 RepID=A0A1U7I669_9CYAN|nr:hypothetical protein [Phormidium ambiguum]OKH31781.1 hypothetical protein NIES2119_27820 [Phormidium ambiguum IAM M-71]
MNAYKTYITIKDPKQVVLSDLPFQSGQRVEVIILAENNQRTSLAQKMQELLKETQVLHSDRPLTEADIDAEIEAYRRGE